MPAIIEIESKQHGAFTYWIDKSVFRIGSQVECEICLPGLPGNTATVQFREGTYAVWNRIDSPLKLGRRQLISNKVGHWQPKKLLQIGPYQLKLLVQGDAQPVPQTSANPFTTKEGKVAPALDEKPSSFNLINVLGVLGIVLIGLFLSSNSSTASQVSLEQVVEQLLANADGTDGHVGKIRTNLQRGQNAESRGNPDYAVYYYMQARDETRQSYLANSVKLDIVNYINQRLDALSW